MPSFSTILQKFGEKGDMTRWTYIEIPMAITDALKPGQKTTFRVKGLLDNYPIKLVALLPLGRSVARVTDRLTGGFMMPVNADMRRGMGKDEEGTPVRVTLDVDNDPLPPSADLLVCLEDDPAAQAYFMSLAPSHQHYFNNWIEDAKTPETKANRIAQAMRGLSMGLNYGEMIRYFSQAYLFTQLPLFKWLIDTMINDLERVSPERPDWRFLRGAGCRKQRQIAGKAPVAGVA